VGGGIENALGVKVTKKFPGLPGVTIFSVRKGSPGGKPFPLPKGGFTTLAPGDIIYRVNNKDVDSAKAFEDAIAAIEPGDTVYIYGRDGVSKVPFHWKGKMPVAKPKKGS
jgi:S1-C subfamily serine protease